MLTAKSNVNRRNPDPFARFRAPRGSGPHAASASTVARVILTLSPRTARLPEAWHVPPPVRPSSIELRLTQDDHVPEVTVENVEVADGLLDSHWVRLVRD